MRVYHYTLISTIYEWQKIINWSFIYSVLFFYYLNILEDVNEAQLTIDELMQNDHNLCNVTIYTITQQLHQFK